MLLVSQNVHGYYVPPGVHDEAKKVSILTPFLFGPKNLGGVATENRLILCTAADTVYTLEM